MPKAWLDGPEGGGVNIQTNGKSAHSTGLCPLSGRCPKSYNEISSPKASNGQRFPPCSTFLGFHGGKRGRGPNWGLSPVQWGDFLSCSSICPFVCPFPPLGHPARPEAQPARPEARGLAGCLGLRPGCPSGPQAWVDGPEGRDVHTNGKTYGRIIYPF